MLKLKRRGLRRGSLPLSFNFISQRHLSTNLREDRHHQEEDFNKFSSVTKRNCEYDLYRRIHSETRHHANVLLDIGI